MDTGVLTIALVATAIAILIVLVEMRASLAPVACPECLHCRSGAEERARRDRELQQTYAREHRLDIDEDDDRLI